MAAMFHDSGFKNAAETVDVERNGDSWCLGSHARRSRHSAGAQS
jgi:hypothetical protein